MAPFADGSPQSSQWPIPPGRFFDYEIHPSSAQAGTAFYHSHVGFQAMTASGPLIVEDAAPLPYAYDNETILHIGDFYPEDDLTVESQLTSIPFVWTGDPQALQINGQSGSCSAGLNASSSCLPYVMDVEPGKTYRVRVIGATSISLVVFGVEAHDNLTIIETDNSYVYPVETSYMQVDSGQRFSFLLATKSVQELQSLGKSSFWIQFETRQGESVVTAWAILNYVDTSQQTSTNEPSSKGPVTRRRERGAPSLRRRQNFSFSSIPSSPVLALPTNVTDWLEYTFQNPPFPGYDPPPTSSEVTRRVVISTLQLLNSSSGHTVMVFNNETWFEGPPLGPTTQTPYLVEILQNGSVNGSPPNLPSANGSGFDPTSQTYPARVGEVIEIVWQNAASSPGGIYGPHPMHAHGGPYWDMGSGPGVYSPELHEETLGANSGWPGSRRDTTILYKYALEGQEAGEVNGWRVWRVRVTAQNVGVWMMHCHILQHMIMGQQTVWVFGTPEEIQQNIQPVDGVLDGYFTYGGDVVGTTDQEDVGMDVARFFE
jgi:FtsP/CotA-like multicopper oxidase with cupredoxin domain